MSLRGDGEKRLDRQRAILDRIHAAEAEARRQPQALEKVPFSPDSDLVPLTRDSAAPGDASRKPDQA